MGTRVNAAIEVYPFDRDELGRTQAGRDFLETFDHVVEWHEADEEPTVDESGTMHVTLYEVNYGTAKFDDEELPSLAEAAGLWYRDGDGGGGTWMTHQRTRFPDGQTIDHLINMVDGTPLLAHAEYQRLAGLDSTVSMDGRVQAYYALGNASLVELAEGAADGSLARTMEAVGMKPLTSVDLERRVVDDKLDPPDPPRLRGPGSNQYEDKPPRPR